MPAEVESILTYEGHVTRLSNRDPEREVVIKAQAAGYENEFVELMFGDGGPHKTCFKRYRIRRVDLLNLIDSVTPED